jgi:translation initiation factor 2B subunit (eIF-2B alpha/beta/delta family)
VTQIPADLRQSIQLIAADRVSGASALLDAAVAVLRRALAGEAPVELVARALCTAQPSMAGLWNASLEAVAARGDPSRFDRFVNRLARSSALLARWGVACLDDGATGMLRIATVSSSRSVLAILLAIGRTRPLHVACVEGRPALEGRGLAGQLAANGVAVTLFGDAAIGVALTDIDAVLVGADAIAPTWVMNKVGTRMLAASAAQQGRPFYVAATREKFVRESTSRRLSIREGDPAEIWAAPVAGVTVRNPYFETTPLDLISGIITDAGTLGVGMIADVCAAAPDDSWLDASALPADPSTQLP